TALLHELDDGPLVLRAIDRAAEACKRLLRRLAWRPERVVRHRRVDPRAVRVLADDDAVAVGVVEHREARRAVLRAELVARSLRVVGEVDGALEEFELGVVQLVHGRLQTNGWRPPARAGAGEVGATLAAGAREVQAVRVIAPDRRDR